MGTVASYPAETVIDDADVFLMQDAATSVTKKAAASEMQKKFVSAGAVPYVSWSPTWTNLTVGNGTFVYRYIQIGKHVDFYIKGIIGSTTTITGTPRLTLPTTVNANMYGSSEAAVIAIAKLLDAGVAPYAGSGQLYPGTNTMVELLTQNVAGTYPTNQGMTASIPFSWGVGDELFLTGSYEAA